MESLAGQAGGREDGALTRKRPRELPRVAEVRPLFDADSAEPSTTRGVVCDSRVPAGGREGWGAWLTRVRFNVGRAEQRSDSVDDLSCQCCSESSERVGDILAITCG